MIDMDQNVQTKWSSHNVSRYKQFGYQFTAINKPLIVKAKELSLYSTEKVSVICDYCGKEFTCCYCTISNGNNGKQACGNCAALKSNEIRHNRMAEEKIEQAKIICQNLGYELLTTSDEYNGVKMQIEFLCNKHGLQKMMLDNLLRGHTCIVCSYEKRGSKKKTSAIEIQETINKDGNTWLNINEFQSANKNNLSIRCKCGGLFIISYHNYKSGKQTRCAKCSQKESIGEKYVREYLENHNIRYEQEKRFEDCRDKRPLPFDFYIPEYNMCIEFDGPHHFWGVYSEEHYEKTKRHDRMKNSYCALKGILLIRIYYYNNKDKIYDLLDSIFNVWVKDIV